MTEDQFIDITSNILNLPKSFKLLEVVKDQKFALEDGMHAHQINDNKIDPKYNISEEDTVRYMMQKKLIKLPSQLSIQQIIAIFMEVFKFETIIMKGYPIHNTIYTFTYLYDSELYEKEKDQFGIIRTLVNSINSFGNYVYELHKESTSIKEDDLSISMFSFSSVHDNVEQIIKDFGLIETTLLNKLKEQKQQAKLYNVLIGIVKLRKGMHNLVKSMGKYFDNKMSAKVQKDIQTLRGLASSIQQLIKETMNELNSEQILKGSGIFSNNVPKTLRSHFGPRDYPVISFLDSINYIKAALDQFELFIPVPNRISLLRDRIQKLHDMPLNLWSKSYIKNNMFHKQEHIFNTLKTQDLILNDMNDFVPLKDCWKTQQKFIALIKPTAPVVSQVMFRYLGRSSRSFWEVSKVYEDYNILIHLSNEFDASLCPPNKKQLYLSSWYYNFGLNVMIKQLFIGIQTELYQHYEYPYVFYILQSLLGVYDRNSQVFLKKFDKIYHTSFFEDTLNTKKKKKVSQANRKYFTDCIFKKALHYYVRSLHRLFFVMVNRKLMQNPFSENLQLNIKNRFRIFKNIYFVRTIDYQQYVRDYQIICQDQAGYLTQAMELLKEAKNLFQKIGQLQQSDCNYKVKEDSQNLTKITVKCSLAIMSLKMGQNKKTYKIQLKHPKYPQVTFC